MVSILCEKSALFEFKIWVYCFMPDHLHLLIEGEADHSDMKRFISSYKQHTSFYHKKKTGMKLWQTNFYEHILRKEEDTMAVVRYILENPVRKGLVDNFNNYPFSGSFVFDISDM